MSDKPKIYIVCLRPYDEASCISSALAEDGEGLVQHFSSNKLWARNDMGLTSRKHHEDYINKYSEGYELVDLIDATDEELKNNEGYIRALDLNIRFAEEDTTIAESIHDEGGPTSEVRD